MNHCFYKAPVGTAITFWGFNFMQKEIWYQLTCFPEFVGIYAITDSGKLKKVARKSIAKYCPDVSEHIYSPKLTVKGYYRYSIGHFRGKKKWVYAHRLVAMQFIPTIEGKPCVNHIDGNKLNNHISNLEWCTNEENNDHAIRMGLVRDNPGKISKENRQFIKDNFFIVGRLKLAEMFGVSDSYIMNVARIKVRGTDQKKKKAPYFKKVIDTVTGTVYQSAKEAASLSGLDFRNLRRALSGERYNRTNLRYFINGEIVNDVLLPPPPKIKIEKPKFVRPPKKEYIPHPKPLKKVIMCDIDGKEVNLFPSTKEACLFTNTNHETFRKAIRTSKNGYHKGYLFRLSS